MKKLFFFLMGSYLSCVAPPPQPPKVVQLAEPVHAEGTYISPDGEHLALVGVDGKVSIWNSTTCAKEHDLPRDAFCFDVAWHPDNTHIALLQKTSLNSPLNVRLWDHTKRRLLATQFNLPIDHLCKKWAPDGSALAVAGKIPDEHTGLVYLLNFWNNHLKTIHHSGCVTDCAWTPDSQQLITSAESPKEHRLEIWPGPYGLLSVEIVRVIARIQCPAAREKKIKIWDPHLETEQPAQDLRVFEANKLAKKDLFFSACSPCGRYIATLDVGSTLTIWDRFAKKRSQQCVVHVQCPFYDTSTKLKWLDKKRVCVGNSDGITLINPFARKKPTIVHLPIAQELEDNPDIEANPMHSYDIGNDATLVAGTKTGQLIIDDRRLRMAMEHNRTKQNFVHALAQRSRTGKFPLKLRTSSPKRRASAPPESLEQDRNKRKRGHK